MARGDVFQYDVSSWDEKKPEEGEELPETEHGEPFGKRFQPERHRLAVAVRIVKRRFRQTAIDHGSPVISTRADFLAGTTMGVNVSVR